MKKFTLLIFLLFCAVGFSQEITVKDNRTDRPIKYDRNGTPREVLKPNVSLQPSETDARTNGLNNPIRYNPNGSQKVIVKPGNSMQPSEASAKNNGQNNPVSFKKQENQIVGPQPMNSNGRPTGVSNLGNNNPLRTAQLPAAYFNSTATAQVESVEGRNVVTHFDTSLRIPFTGTYGSTSTNLADDLLYDNGPYFNIVGPPKISQLQDASLGMGTYGPACNASGPFTITDDFILTDDAEISSIDFYGYQTGSVPPTINGIFVKIWNGDPSGGGTVIWGDMVTNRHQVTVTSGAYRQLESAPGNTTREIQKVTANTTGLSLNAGTYWVEYMFTGTGSSGPWAAPIVITGNATTGNALQSNAGVWAPIVDVGPQGMPFQIYGTFSGGGGTACSQNNPSNAFENAFTTSKNGLQIIATDINVPADTDFTLNTITVNIFGAPGSTITSADIAFYNNAATNLPGTTRSTQTAVVPTSQTVIGSNFGLNISEVVFNITPEMLEGQAGSTKVYWVSLYVSMSAGSGYLEGTSTSIVGLNNAFSADAGVSWNVNAGWDSVYVFDGDCEPIGGGGTFPAPYCGPIDYAIDVEPITLVEVAGISNRTSGVVNGSPAHEDFTAITGSMTEGDTYTISLEGNTNGSYTNSFTVFIDWNQDGILDNASERYQIGTITGSTGNDGQQVTGTITVPAGVVDGPTRMRVMKQFGTTYPTDSCTGTNWGQAEDYTINVTSGGGTGDTCSEENPNDFTFENGYNCSSTAAFKTANDLTVAADEDFTLENITASIFANGGVANVDVNYYSDASGLPGTLIGSEASVTITSQAVIGANFGFDVNEVKLAVTPFTFAGQSGATTKYWVELSVTDGGSTGGVYWVVTSSSMIGSPVANFDGGWANPDVLMDGVYIWEGTCEPMGGTGDTCSEENPNDFTFENGYNCSSTAAFKTANDLTVAADEDFTLENITASIFANGGVTNVDVNYYSDASGLPGTLIGSEASVTITSQAVIGANFGFDVNEVKLAVTPFTFAGQSGATTKYWVELSVTDGGSTGGVYWVVTSSSMIGSPVANFDGGWANPDVLMDGVYIWEGSCEPMGGTGDTCSEENPNDFTFENGYNCSSAAAFQTANDITVAAGETFTLENITASIFANGGITNVDVKYYANASGLPGALIGSQNSVTIDNQTVIGANFGFDVNEIELSVTPFTFVGQNGAPTTYWIELSVTDGSSSGGVYWVVTSSTMKGNPIANFDGGWTNPDVLMDGVYIWEGQCDALSIGDNTLVGFTYYPNPTSDVLNFSSDKNIESVSLFNLLGQKVLTLNVGSTSSFINMEGLSTGTYIMKVSVGGQTGTYKIIKY